MNIPEDTAHVAEALALLLEQYKGKPDFEALLASYIEQVQLLEVPAHDLYAKRTLDDAVKAQLDDLGDVVRQIRTSSDDDVFRAWVIARIAINRSNGHAEEIINILRLVSAATDDFTVRDLGNAAIAVDIFTGVSSAWADVLIDLARESKAGGVRIYLFWSTQPESNSFQFASALTKDWRLVPDYSHNFHFILDIPIAPLRSGVQYRVACKAQKDEYDHVILQGNSLVFPGVPFGTFDLTNGTLDASANIDSGSIVDEGGGVYAVEIRATPTSTGDNSFFFGVADGTDPHFPGNNSDGLFIKDPWISEVGVDRNLFERPDNLLMPNWTTSRLTVTGRYQLASDALKGYSNATQTTGGYMVGVKT